MTKVDKKPRPPRRGTRFPGIVAAAKAAGCRRTSMFRALTGEWNLPRLVKAYHDYRAQGGTR